MGECTAIQHKGALPYCTAVSFHLDGFAWHQDLVVMRLGFGFGGFVADFESFRQKLAVKASDSIRMVQEGELQEYNF